VDISSVAKVYPGESVLVHAAAGKVGSVLAQVSRYLGAGKVVGTVGSPDKIDYAKSLGYDHVLLCDDITDVRVITGLFPKFLQHLIHHAAVPKSKSQNWYKLASTSPKN
jgi:NADPH:quinone reductase-like Zn-dependent oxidoreductase